MNMSDVKPVRQQLSKNVIKKICISIDIKKMNIQDTKKRRLVRRKHTIRKKIKGSDERLRLSIYRSLNHIYAQVIDDVQGKTLATASTLDKELKEKMTPGLKKTEKSKLVGKLIAERAIANNIKKVTFDRNGKLYHGRVKAFAEAAREGGLEF